MKRYYVYVLRSKKDGRKYIGYTANLSRRLLQHNNGDVISTRFRRPLDLIFYEAYLNQSDALRREDYFKTTAGKRALKIMLREYLKENSNPVIDIENN